MHLILTCQACGSANAHRLSTGRQLCDDCMRAETSSSCAFCGANNCCFEGSIHRDGFCLGPQVPLCATCAAEEGPTCDEIWAKISTLAGGLTP